MFAGLGEYSMGSASVSSGVGTVPLFITQITRVATLKLITFLCVFLAERQSSDTTQGCLSTDDNPDVARGICDPEKGVGRIVNQTTSVAICSTQWYSVCE